VYLWVNVGLESVFGNGGVPGRMKVSSWIEFKSSFAPKCYFNRDFRCRLRLSRCREEYCNRLWTRDSRIWRRGEESSVEDGVSLLWAKSTTQSDISCNGQALGCMPNSGLRQ
jgi:hypothetical protein